MFKNTKNNNLNEVDYSLDKLDGVKCYTLWYWEGNERKSEGFQTKQRVHTRIGQLVASDKDIEIESMPGHVKKG